MKNFLLGTVFQSKWIHFSSSSVQTPAFLTSGQLSQNLNSPDETWTVGSVKSFNCFSDKSICDIILYSIKVKLKSFYYWLNESLIEDKNSWKSNLNKKWIFKQQLNNSHYLMIDEILEDWDQI